MHNEKQTPILVRDPESIRLAKARAQAENRSNANAAATTIIEALSNKPYANNKPGTRNWQGEIITKDSPGNNNGAGQ